MGTRNAAPRANAKSHAVVGLRRGSRLVVAEAELATARLMLDVMFAELEACQAERDQLQVELANARELLQNAHDEVSELGRLVKSVVVGSRRGE